jgi:hypothetical protein
MEKHSKMPAVFVVESPGFSFRWTVFKHTQILNHTIFYLMML